MRGHSTVTGQRLPQAWVRLGVVGALGLLVFWVGFRMGSVLSGIAAGFIDLFGAIFHVFGSLLL